MFTIWRRYYLRLMSRDSLVESAVEKTPSKANHLEPNSSSKANFDGTQKVRKFC